MYIHSYWNVCFWPCIPWLNAQWEELTLLITCIDLSVSEDAASAAHEWSLILSPLPLLDDKFITPVLRVCTPTHLTVSQVQHISILMLRLFLGPSPRRTVLLFPKLYCPPAKQTDKRGSPPPPPHIPSRSPRPS